MIANFRVWRENRYAIVGPNFRLGYMRKTQKGYYEASGQCQQNLVLTSGAFLHRVGSCSFIVGILIEEVAIF